MMKVMLARAVGVHQLVPHATMRQPLLANKSTSPLNESKQ